MKIQDAPVPNPFRVILVPYNIIPENFLIRLYYLICVDSV